MEHESADEASTMSVSSTVPARDRLPANLFKFPVFRNWYDFRDRMEKANRNGECDEIERFATSLGRNPHCTYNSETQSHTLQVGGESVTITREDFDDRKWQKKIRKATQSKRSPYN